MNNNIEIKIYPATVVKVLNDFEIVINRGEEHKIKKGQRFLIYNLSQEEIKDPESGESLGYLEIIKGIGEVTHVQPKISSLKSCNFAKPEKRLIKRRNNNPIASLFGGGSIEEEEIINPSENRIPFEGVIVGDKAKPI